MRNVDTKVDGVDSMPAANYNAQRDELENAVLSSDQSLDPNAGPDTDLNMLGQAIAAYANAGNVYQDSGVADAYVLSITTNLKTVTKYYDNMMVVFKAGNANTGATTVNVNALGVKSLTLTDGTALGAGDISAGRHVFATYSLSNDRFELTTGVVATLFGFNVYVHATDGDYPTLAAYLAATPTAGDSVLYDADETFTAGFTVPTDIQIQQVWGRVVTFGGTSYTTAITLAGKAKLAGRFTIEFTHSGTITNAIIFNASSADVDDLMFLSTAGVTTITNGVVLVSGLQTCYGRLSISSSNLTITNPLADNSAKNSNDIILTDIGNNTVHRSDGANIINGLATKVIEIGDWNMDSDLSKGVTHGIADYTKIRSVQVIIRDDTSTNLRPLSMVDTTGTDSQGGVRLISTTNISLYRLTGGDFDSSDFDSTSYNRGWVTVTYEA